MLRLLWPCERERVKSYLGLHLQGSPEAPQCGFSNQVCRILDAYGALPPARHLADM